MHIGILTFHRADNFGAVLQCYALQTFVESLGHNVEIIDYRCKKLERSYHLIDYQGGSIKNRIKNIIYSILTLKFRYCKRNKYQKFRRDYLKITKQVYNDCSFKKDFDYVIVGSDQVWNLRLTNGWDSSYFLDFEDGAKRISYAASSEAKDYNGLNEYISAIRKVFNHYEAISVRENEFASYLMNLTNQKVDVVLDPTFLLKADNYKTMACVPKCTKYVLVYNLVPSSEAISLAQQYAKENSLDIVVIEAGFSPHNIGKTLQDTGPLELLGYLIYAECIFTTSFHGLALSLINRKNVFVVNKGPNTRLLNLLQCSGNANRLIIAGLPTQYTNMNFSEEFKEKIAESKIFLSNHLK